MIREILILVSVIIPFLVVLGVMPFWIRKCRNTGLVWEDMNKYDSPKNVASSGGIIVILAFILGLLYYVAIRTFFVEAVNSVTLYVFALIGVILIFGIIGLIDDLLGWKNGGLSKRFRIILAFIASIPYIVLNAGVSTMNVPFLGVVDFGLIYPLILIPLGIAGASTTYNFLAGFNGLEASQGILIVGFLSFVAYTHGSLWLALVGVLMVSALITFYIFNKYPAKVFPGDILTYSIGALIASMAILGNFEKIAVFVFIPYIIEVMLKLRGGLKKHSFAKPNKDNSLEMPYKKIYGLTHFSLFVLKKFKSKVYEKDVVYFINIIQIIFILLAFVLFL